MISQESGALSLAVFPVVTIKRAQLERRPARTWPESSAPDDHSAVLRVPFIGYPGDYQVVLLHLEHEVWTSPVVVISRTIVP